MSPRITAFLIGLLSVTASLATVVAPADSTIITTGDSIVAATSTPDSIAQLATDSLALPLTALDSMLLQQKADQNLLSTRHCQSSKWCVYSNMPTA